MSDPQKDEVIEKVENFIQKIHDKEYEILPQAGELWFGDPKDKESMRCLADNLSNAIVKYELHKKSPEYASICTFWIEKAFTYGVVKDRSGMPKKLQKCKEENTRLHKENQELREDNQKISVEYLTLEGKYEELKRSTVIVSKKGKGGNNYLKP